jgi:hypothetical protein
MRRILFIGLCLAMSLVATSSAMADTFGLGSSYMPLYNGVIVGPIGGSTLGGNPINGGATCNSPELTSYLGSSWSVNVSTLDPSNPNLGNTKYGLAGLTNYEEAAVLLGQIPSHTSEVGEIQFAIWRIFNPTYMKTKFGSATIGEQTWMNWAASTIIVPGIDYSSVRIYTALDNHNQEFISGVGIAPPHAPIPSAAWLLGSGLLGLVGWRRVRKS